MRMNDESYAYKKINHSIQPALDKQSIQKLHQWILSLIASESPTYHSFDQSSPNFLKINNLHPKSTVTGNFIQYNFFSMEFRLR